GTDDADEEGGDQLDAVDEAIHAAARELLGAERDVERDVFRFSHAMIRFCSGTVGWAKARVCAPCPPPHSPRHRAGGHGAALFRWKVRSLGARLCQPYSQLNTRPCTGRACP